MGAFLYLLENFIFPGLADEGKEKIKSAYEQLTKKIWEELFVAAFQQALSDQKTYLQKYGDGIVKISPDDIKRVLRQEFFIDIEDQSLSTITGDDFSKKIAKIISDKGLLVIGGNVLSEADYASIVSNLVCIAQSKFRQSIFQDENAFKKALLNQVENNTSLLEQLERFLNDKYSLLITIDQKLDGLTELVNGIRGSICDYSGQVGEFVRHYLGTPEEPAPFGGRYDQLDQLDCWLDATDQPQYASIIAPAGRGKSALLVHWVTRLASKDQQKWRVVYFPISSRYDTNREEVVLGGMVVRLAAILNKQESKAQSADEYRHRWLDYLQNLSESEESILVVLDGLDEAAFECGLALFPEFPPKNLKVLVAARPLANDEGFKDWQRRMGWTHSGRAINIDLPFLTYPGFLDVLKQMGNPLDQLPKRAGIAEKLFELSEGDPLLVGLYIGSLLEKRQDVPKLTCDDLQKLTPGIESFMRSWMDDQKKLWKNNPLREKSVRTFLNLCALAYGPLSKADMSQLAPEIFESAELIELAAQSMDRIIISTSISSGENQVSENPIISRGYIFSHPRLADYFANNLLPGERINLQVNFVEYGQRQLTAMNQKIIRYTEISPYILQYYRQHLAAIIKDPEEAYALIDEAWLRAWESFSGTADGFLSDLDWVNEIAKSQGSSALLQQTQVALCHASVNSLCNHIDEALFSKLLNNRVISISQAKYYIGKQLEVTSKDNMLMHLALFLQNDHLSELSDNVAQLLDQINTKSVFVSALINLMSKLPEGAARVDLWRKALAVAETITSEWERALALSDLTGKLPEGGARNDLWQKLLDAAEAITFEEYRAGVLSDLAGELPEGEERTDLWRKALAVAEAITGEGKRARVLSDLAEKLPDGAARDNLWRKALAAAEAIADEGYRAGVLSDLVKKLPEGAAREEVWWEALAAAKAITDDGGRARVLSDLAGNSPEGAAREELWRQALAAAEAITEEVYRADVLSVLAENSPEGAVREELLRQALAAAKAISDERERALVLSDLVEKLPEGATREELWRKALAVAEAITDEGERARVLSVLAENSPEGAKREELWRQALAAAKAISDEGYRAGVLSDLAGELPEGEERADLLRKALAVAEAITDEGERARVLSDLAEKLPKGAKREELWRKALVAAEAIAEEVYRASVLSDLVEKLPEGATRENLWREALAAAEAITDVGYHARVLSDLVGKLSEEEAKADLTRKALAVAETITDEGYRANVLSYLVGKLPEGSGRADLWRKALAVAEAITNTRYYALVLSDLVEKLPEGAARKDLWREALAAVEAILDKGDRAGVLSDLAGKLPEEATREDLWRKALAAAEAITNTTYRALVLSDLVEKLPEGATREELWRKALAVAEAITDKGECADVLSVLAENSPQGAAREELWRKALAVAETITDEGERASVLSDLAEKLPEGAAREELWRKVLAAAEAITDEVERARVITELAIENHNIVEKHKLYSEVIKRLQFSSYQKRGYIQKIIEDITFNKDFTYLFTMEFSTNTIESDTLSHALQSWITEMQPSENELYTTYQKVLHEYTGDRGELLLVLPVFSSYFMKVGGIKLVIDLSNVIEEIAVWWP